MKIKIMQFIVIFALTNFCVQAVINVKQAEALQNTSTGQDIQDIQQVWEKGLMGFANRDIDSIMETMSRNYSWPINGAVIDYAGIKTRTEKNITEFFDNHISCSVEGTKILKSGIIDSKAVVEFEYQFYAFEKNSMQWVTYTIVQEVTFSKENGDWKIIKNGDRQILN